MVNEPTTAMQRQAGNKPSRRQLLMQTAEALFAERGIDSVSLNEINKAAGQRNTSAIHYHFGSKDGLVQAIVYEHYEGIDRDINRLLDEYEALPEAGKSVRGLIEALVTPFADQLDSDKGVNYLLIVREILNKSSDMMIKGHPEGRDKARLRVFAMFQQVLAGLPAAIGPARLVLCSGVLFNSLATYAQFGRASDGLEVGNKALFVNNLLDIMEAIMTAPPSASTMDVV